MRHSSLPLLVAEADGRARAFGAVPEARLAIVEMALSCLRQALEDTEQPSAWERVALILADQRALIPVDALELTPLERAQRRLRLLTELPEVTGFASFQDVTVVISNAINIGAPSYNSGDIRGCAALYWIIIRLICEAPATRGFPGYARLQGQLKPLAEPDAPIRPMTPQEADAYAWELRHALDATVRDATAS